MLFRVSCVLTLFLAAPAFAANLLTNGGFDTGLSGWKVPTDSFHLSWSPLDANGSAVSGSGQITTDQIFQPGATANFYQEVSVTPGVAYSASVKGIIPQQGSLSGIIQLRILGDAGGLVVNGFSAAVSDPRSWVTLTADFTPPAGVHSVRFWLYVWRLEESGVFSAYFDDASLVVAQPPAITIAGPAAGRPEQPMAFQATAAGCTPSRSGWSWTTVQNSVLSGGSTGSVTVVWPAAGTFTLSASNSGCPGVSGSTSVTIAAAPPNIVATAHPAVLVQGANEAGATASYTLFNEGDTATTITLAQKGSFFTQSPQSFVLTARASQTVTLKGVPQPANAYHGMSIPSGAGVPVDLAIPVVLLSTEPPAAPPRITQATNRVDVFGAPADSTGGSVTFVNSGEGTMTGVLAATVPWLLPQEGLITIPPGDSREVSFSVDRSKRPDAESPRGSVTGELQLVYSTPALGKAGILGGGPPGISIVTVVDTAKPPVGTGPLPALAPGEVVLFVPGVGHAPGSVGVFLSDLSILNTSATGSISDLKLYYTPLGGAPTSQIVSLAPVAAAQPLAMADLVRTVFSNDSQVGSLQIRSADISKVALNASIFNASNARGTFGTTIPVFRSDRAAAPGTRLYLTGLRADATSHTNIYLQETSGLGSTVSIDFLTASGTVAGSRTETVGPFVMVQLGRAVPEGAVAAVLTNTATSPGRFLAYATPVDRNSGDTWAVVDWRQQDGYSGGKPVVIPIAGALHGANNTYFRTDVAVMNIGAGTDSAVLRYYNRTGEVTDKTLTLAPLESRILNDVITTLFAMVNDSAGYLVFTPASGTFVVTSRTYTTVINDVATYGTGVPTRAFEASLRAGDVRRVGGIDDSAIATVAAARPATFRTNFSLVETAGETATIRVTVRASAATGKVSASLVGWKDYVLSPRQFLLPGGITREVLGAGRDAFGDLHNVQIEFAHIGGNGAVDLWLSSVDNGTGDSLLRVE